MNRLKICSTNIVPFNEVRCRVCSTQSGWQIWIRKLYRNAIVNTSIYDVVVVQSLLLMDVHYRAGIANIPMSELRILRVHVLVSVHAHQFMFFCSIVHQLWREKPLTPPDGAPREFRSSCLRFV